MSTYRKGDSMTTTIPTTTTITATNLQVGDIVADNHGNPTHRILSVTPHRQTRRVICQCAYRVADHRGIGRWHRHEARWHRNEGGFDSIAAWAVNKQLKVYRRAPHLCYCAWEFCPGSSVPADELPHAGCAR